MNGSTKVWPRLASCLCIASPAHGQTPAVVATDVPITVGETMQNDASLADVTFVDAATGWAVGDRGVIWHTADAGKTWQLQASGVAANLTFGLLPGSRAWLGRGR